MRFYLTCDEKGNVSFSLCPGLDKPGAGTLRYLSPALPLGCIQDVLGQIHQQKPVKEIEREILKQLKRMHLDFEWNWKDAAPSPLARAQKNKGHAWGEFNRRMVGRQCTTGDLKAFAQEVKLTYEDVLECAQYNVQQELALWVPAVIRNGRGWKCQRCGEIDVEEWPSLYGLAATCRSCQSIGPSTSLDALYRDQRARIVETSEVMFKPHWVLTEAQRLASEQILDFVKGPVEASALLWAACGAGKTEVCFPAAAWALRQGKTLLFAAPRQDVILDIAPRIQRDFPGYPYQCLTGSIPNKFQVGGLVLATTHQVLRFWQCFDYIFLDEMDAFPYYGSEALEWGIHHALRPDGKILYLTATPSAESLSAVEEGKMRLIRLPARHHRKPVPVPTWERTRRTSELDANLQAALTHIETLRIAGPVLVFVPKISWVRSSIEAFKAHFPAWRVGGSYSSDMERKMNIEQLCQGRFDLFVSTSILERGITLSGVQVIILAADHPVFDARALVQMAGRTGRTHEHPDGQAIFIAQHLTPAMRTAIQWVEEQNQQASMLGLIDVNVQGVKEEGCD